MKLKDVDLAQITRSGDHFKKVLRTLFELIPNSAHNIAGFARWTGINKSTSQRLVQAYTKSSDGIETIILLPGPEGLEQVAGVLGEKKLDESFLEEFESLIALYRDLIYKYANSQSELKRILQKVKNQKGENKEYYQKETRKQLYQNNSELTGESVDIYLGVNICRVNPNDPSLLDELIVAHRKGVYLDQGARPFVQSFAGNEHAIHTTKPLDVEADHFPSLNEDGKSDFLFKDYSTPGIGKCFAGLGKPDNSLIYDHTLLPDNNEKFNITLAHFDRNTQPNPLFSERNVSVQSAMCRSPAKRLILICFMSKELASRSILKSGCYPTSIKVQEVGHHPEEQWSEKISDTPRVQLFDPSFDRLYERVPVPYIDDLVKQGFDLIGESAKNYAGYLMDVEYPLWLTSHRMYFVFS